MAVLSLAFLLVGFALTSADKVSLTLIVSLMMMMIILNIKHVCAAAALIPERKVCRDPRNRFPAERVSKTVSFLFTLAGVSAHTAPSVKCMLTLHTRGLRLLHKTCEIEAFCVRKRFFFIFTRGALNLCSAAAAAAAAPPAPPAPAPAGHLAVKSPPDLH